MTVRVYTAKHCPPCHEVEQLIKRGKVAEEVELIDIETDEGFLKFREEVLKDVDGVVPSAYKDGKRCAIKIDDENEMLVFECPTDVLPSSQKG